MSTILDSNNIITSLLNSEDPHVVDYILVVGKQLINPPESINYSQHNILAEYNLDFSKINKYNSIDISPEIFTIQLYENKYSIIKFSILDTHKEYISTTDIFSDLDKILCTHETANQEVLDNLDEQIIQIKQYIDSHNLNNYIITLKYNVLMYYPKEVIKSIREYIIEKLQINN